MTRSPRRRPNRVAETAPRPTRRASVTLGTKRGTFVAAYSGVAEVLIEYDAIVAGQDGRRWSAHVCGRRRDDDNMWEGWVEFVPKDRRRRPVRSRRETTQPSRDDLLYWATGLTPVYLSGALGRALEPPFERPRARDAKPHFDGPAPSVVSEAAGPSVPHPILDPFDVYGQGEDILVRQLDALDTPRLRDIALAYELMQPRDAERASRLQLATTIIDGARSSASRV